MIAGHGSPAAERIGTPVTVPHPDRRGHFALHSAVGPMTSARGPEHARTASQHIARPGDDPKEPPTSWVYPSDASRMPARASGVSHLAISVPTLEECSHCHEMKLPHHVCPNCGYYQGRLAVQPKKRTPADDAAR